jgi:hypothetical protein
VAAPAASNGKVDEVGATAGTSNQKADEAGVVGEPAAFNRNINQAAAADTAWKSKVPKAAASNRKAGKAGESKRQRHLRSHVLSRSLSIPNEVSGRSIYCVSLP